MFTALHNFCAVDLSAFYFDIRKDRLYCDAADDPARRATRTVMDRTFDCLVRWLAPILCFTAEEAWLARHGDAPGRSVHLELFPEVPAAWHDAALAARWAGLRDLRRVVTGALEVERAAKRIGSSLQAAVEIYVPERLLRCCASVDLAELCITSAGTARPEPPPEGAFTLPDAPGIGVVVACRRRPLRALLAGAAGSRACPRPRRSVPALRRCARPRRHAARGGGRVMIARTMMLAVASRWRPSSPCSISSAKPGCCTFSARPAAPRISFR